MFYVHLMCFVTLRKVVEVVKLLKTNTAWTTSTKCMAFKKHSSSNSCLSMLADTCCWSSC